MKKIMLVSLLLLFVNPSFSQETTSLKDVQHSNLYNKHHIIIVKEEKDSFSSSIQKKTLLNINLVGTDTSLTTSKDSPFISTLSNNDYNEQTINVKNLKSEITVNISTEEQDKQIITIKMSDLTQLHYFFNNDNIIKLPHVQGFSFQTPINSNSFEQTLYKCDDITYKLKYSGEKSL